MHKKNPKPHTTSHTAYDLLPSCILIPQRSKSSGEKFEMGKIVFITLNSYCFADESIFIRDRYTHTQRHA